MRILDSKDERDQEFIPDAPRISDYLCDACREHFDDGASAPRRRAASPYVVDDTLVRGLDYYTRTAWEWIPIADGRAQATISGGGRYDGLAEQIGGKRTPGVGFGCGVERLVLALEKIGREPARRGCDWFVRRRRARGAPGRAEPCSTRPAANGLSAEMDLAGRSLKGQLRHAQPARAPESISVVGPDEWARGVARLRDDEVPEDDVPFERLVVAVEEALMLMTDTEGR